MENNTVDIEGREVSRIIPPSGKYFAPVNKPYKSPTSGEITIVAITPNKGEEAPSLELCSEIASCGFNSALMTITLPQISTALTNCGNVGIRPFLSHSHLSKNEQICKEFVNQFKGNPNLGGWDLIGQPSYNELSNPDGIRKYYNLICQNDPNHCVFINIPGEAENSLMNDHSYKEYLELFQDVLNPSFFPYVMYPITGPDTQPNVRYDTFFNDLEIFSLIAKYSERPFWAYVRSQAFKNVNGTEGPAPTEGQLKFAVFSALAYGAQGLVYWTYRQRSDKSTEKYTIAPIDRNGNKTRIWNYVQSVNKQVKALNDIFCGAYFIQCRHTGDAQYRGKYSFALEGEFGPCNYVKSYGKGVLVSMLNNNGINYLIIVNHDTSSNQTVDLEFNKYWRVKQVTVDNFIQNSTSVSSSVTKTLLPGGYLIFTWI